MHPERRKLFAGVAAVVAVAITGEMIGEMSLALKKLGDAYPRTRLTPRARKVLAGVLRFRRW